MNFRHLMICTAFLMAAPHVAAQVYSCGPGCYTSSPKRGSGKADLGNRIGSYTAVTPRTVASNDDAPKTNTSARRTVSASGARPIAVANAVPVSSVPKLSAAKANDRRTILEQELNNERNALANAQKALAEGRAVSGQSDAGHQNRIRSLESAVLDRQQNIQALQRELGRM